MRDFIVVVGGYGHVGSIISAELGRIYPGKVLAGGRNEKQAKRFCLKQDGRVLPLTIDIYEKPDPDLFAKVKVVIMCIDQTDTMFSRYCLEQGIHYIDISANFSFLSQVRSLQWLARSRNATAVLGVGLAPGLTNLLAMQASALMEQTEAIDISIMLGIGDTHGKAAIEWTIEHMLEESSLTDCKEIDFGQGFGTRKAYRFDFADQHMLASSGKVPSVSTRLCFDPAVLTTLLVFLKKTGMLRALRNKQHRERIVHRLVALKAGKALFAVKIDGYGFIEGKHAHVECFLHGSHEAEATAIVAVWIASALYANEHPRGVFYIEEFVDFEMLAPALKEIASVCIRVERYLANCLSRRKK
ncbi:MAG TPA: saccharopine dehydrogenase NADP-binding domain-containing protein [Candidatus Bathyarchaeia archaeon]|nr:saccharopine dehydrogenase NADP-binding domain-containing protein [Candidatus Bathyarchaeia archaeon]